MLLNNIYDIRWLDWLWHSKRAARDLDGLKRLCPSLSDRQIRMAEEWERRGLRFELTPYVLSLIEPDKNGNPKQNDPIWRQFFPAFEELLTGQSSRPDEYSPQKENWEEPGEMLTPIAHWKYPNRIILYIAESCLSYCTYCLRSLQSKAKEERHGSVTEHWSATMTAIRDHPQIEEVILSGGDPLVDSNYFINRMLRDIREIPSVRAVRIHTRALTHNPFRIDGEFCGLLREYRVTELAVHVVHPREITDEFHAAVDRICASGARTMLLAQIPLIKGVNDSVEVLRELFMGLYVLGVKPYYLLHNMPNIPAAATQRTSVRRGVELMLALKRHISNPAMPEYIIVDKTGKKTVPLELDGTPEFRYENDPTGHPLIRFKNWKGDWVEYLDAP